MDKLTQALVHTLKQALLQPGEQRLFRSGKLPGIFAGRAGANADAAARALREGLLEITRTETKGKVTTEWVRVTPPGVEFVHQHESPVQVLRELLQVLQTTQHGVPGWITEFRSGLQALGDRLEEQAQRITFQINALSQRVAEAIDQAESGGSRLTASAAAAVEWGPKVLEYLDKRQSAAATGGCTLPELFAALRNGKPELTIAQYHAGLRRLQDRGIVRLLPVDGPDGLAEPEFAMPDGAVTYYQVAR